VEIKSRVKLFIINTRPAGLEARFRNSRKPTLMAGFCMTGKQKFI
jgi:hypothetical protein